MRIPPSLSLYASRMILCLILGLGVSVDCTLMAESLYGVDQKKVEVTVLSHFLNDVPNRGVMTLDLRIKNNLTSSEEWTFHFETYLGWDRKKILVSQRSVSVDAKSAKTVRWEIPVFPSTELKRGQKQRLSVSVEGPGAEMGSNQELFNSSRNYTSGNRSRSFVAVSPFLSVTRNHWDFSKFQKIAGNNNETIQVTEFDNEAVPTNLMGLSGVDILLMTAEEWEDLSENHPVLLRWLSGGGQVVLLGENDQESTRLGMGLIHRFAFSNESKIVKRLSLLETFTSQISNENDYSRRNWKMSREIPKIQNSFGWMMLVVISIAALLGPINIWLSFRRKNTLQVIWSTPLISMALSILIIIGILFSDGFGGKGQRAQWVFLFYDQGIEISIQEQVSRTGVLLGNRFSLPEETEIYQLPSEAGRARRQIRYEQLPDGDWMGDWFENRNIQAQVLRRMRTSRSAVTYIAGEKPAIISSVDATFSRILVYDEDGGAWIAQKVSPGEKHFLQPANQKEVRAFQKDLTVREEFIMNGVNVLEQEGWFYAETLEEERYIDTVSSVRWKNRPIWFLGPVKGGVKP